MSIRTDKVASLLQRELSAIFEKELPRSGPLVTVVEVKVTADLGIARVYLSLIGSEKQRADMMTYLQNEVKAVRKLLSSRIRHQFRRIPELEFFEDEQYEKARRIEELLRDALGGSAQERDDVT
ncbi:30S ribosome-binding factor RbfA [Prosthecochloris sp. HL-130-GSB]|jgi:ribosome-binding factor A|uniref:Ribosome-binding factor A n=1 Tax=Prosthecochloris aestuarii TaxID=1102 RepID=A0A831SSU5_PROAE|nr:30S ribosome-binding factor RbfA [Prosthecochloris sp. HL-130-GSB]ARM30281.1 ribosome-binding factor A [Prosthecochloris sp. HL-130-GSB]MBO8091891.1 30S ribosome-binding factor RbfA [Prosthecochloris sp.]HED31488.1 30S ribosome-binding factor RbfA [Prosthecochloris aestuarii]